MRVLIYTHNTMGLGHAARASALAQAILSHSPHSSILFVGGVNLEKLGWLPSGTDQLKLPSFSRNMQQGKLYTSPRLKGVDKGELSNIRSEILRAVFTAYNPEAVIVDFFPRGKMNELVPALTAWKNVCPSGLLCFGLRGVIDSPDRAFTEALDVQDLEALNVYDVIWAYCDRRVVDLKLLHPELIPFSPKIVYTGYVSRGRRVSTSIAQTQRKTLGIDDEALFVLVSLGFGWMSERILSTVIEAIQYLAQNHSVKCLILSGDHMTIEAKEKIEAVQMSHAQIFLASRFVQDPLPYMQAADVFISRGGYNTLTDIISCGRPAVVIPSVVDGNEQWVHAKAISQLGFCDVIPEDVVTPFNLADTVIHLLANWTPPKIMPDITGAQQVALWLTNKLGG